MFKVQHMINETFGLIKAFINWDNMYLNMKRNSLHHVDGINVFRKREEPGVGG